MRKYDVVVIGAGPGGYIAAGRTAELGLKTAIVEKDSLGGVCLNVGCIPSKALLKNAEIARTLRKNAKTFGISFDNLQLDYSAAVDRSRKVVKRLNQGVAFLMKNSGVDVFEGTAVLEGDQEIRIDKISGETEMLEAKSIILATGAHPIDIQGVEADGERILNYRQAILQTKLPKSIVIVGGGAIGVEFATIWNSYGTEVTIIEMKNQLVPNEDEEAGSELERAFKKQGIKVKTGTKLAAVDKTETGVIVHTRSGTGESEIFAEQILIAVGFQPNSNEIGLTKAGVVIDNRGWIKIDEYCQTNVPNIYAIGDISGKVLLAHSASAMGKIAAEKIAGIKTQPLNIDLVPHATYSFPQIASFGITEETAAERGIAVRIGKAGFIANGKALGIGENEGWAKIISDAATGQILGASMVGPEVSELLPELTLASGNHLTVNAIYKNIHAHPTLSEILMEAAENISINP
ncbi:MAG: dihydrolipoyl dehydrogenase [Flexilinea sp.]